MIEPPDCSAPWYDKLDWCIQEIVKIEYQLEKQSKPIPTKPWYTSFGIWFAIVLTLLVLAIIYIFYLSTLGYTTPYLPNWMK